MTGLNMPKPMKVGSTYYLRVTVPADVAEAAKGTTTTLLIGNAHVRVVVGTHVKASLRTKDTREARQRFTHAYAALLGYWEALRQSPMRLSHKQCSALAGEVRATFIDVTDDDPGTVGLWENILLHDAAAKNPRLPRFEALRVGPPTEPSNVEGLEVRWGGFTDAILSKHFLVVDEETRWRLLGQVARAMQEVPMVNLRKAQGDYSDTGETDKYPAFRPARPASSTAQARPKGPTFSDVVDETAKRRAAGRDAKPLSADVLRKYRLVCEEFAAHRRSNDLETVTALEVDSWMQDMKAKGTLSNNTINQKVQNLGTVVGWARKQSLGALFPNGNPVDAVERPKAAPVDSSERTLRQDEAEAILRASRLATKPELRWAPWLMAYSGARVSEIAQLTPEDFFSVGEDWFFRLSTHGQKTLKNANMRRVPIHPDVMAEGLLDYVRSVGPLDTTRLFGEYTGRDLRTWVHSTVGINRKALAPNHGWRHLFEDKAMEMPGPAKLYITGRSKGGSGENYGRSDAMLPMLAALMRKFPSYLDD